ncbi:MAG TPA: hypothetical protein VF753_16395 [Terriglobales bacterium]
MGGLIEPSPLADEKDSSLRPVLIAIVLVAVLIGGLVLASIGGKKSPAAPHPYAANVQLSNLKMSQAENFVGASVTYIDGTVTNAGNQTVTHAVAHVAFKNSLNEVAQVEDVALHVLSTSGPYPDAVDLSVSPLAPGQSKPFRLTFEHISADWDQAYPELQVTSVSLK